MLEEASSAIRRDWDILTALAIGREAMTRSVRWLRLSLPALLSMIPVCKPRLSTCCRLSLPQSAREAVAERHREAEHDLERAVISDAQFRTVDDAYIAANNRIAAANRAVDAFLAQNREYRVT